MSHRVMRVVLHNFSGPLYSQFDVCRYENKGRRGVCCVLTSFAFTSKYFWTDTIIDSNLTTKLDTNVEERMVSSKNKSMLFQNYYNFEIYRRLTWIFFTLIYDILLITLKFRIIFWKIILLVSFVYFLTPNYISGWNTLNT
jgi:hypothetical protein